MKNKGFRKLLALVVLVGFTVASCNKDTGNIGPYLGIWHVSLTTITYNDNGQVLSEVTESDNNTIEILEDPDKLNGHLIKTNLLMKQFEPVSYVLEKGSGGVFFSPDISNDRINFWYYGATSAVSKDATIISKSSQKLVLGAATLFPVSTTLPSQNSLQRMQTLTLTR